MSFESWEEVKLSDICKIKHGYAFKGEFFSDEPTKNLLLTPGNFAIGGGFKADKFKYYNGEIPDDYILKGNDLIVTMTDLSKEADTLGYSAKVPLDTSKVFLHNQRLGLVTLTDKNYDSDFIYWLMRSEHYQKFVAGSATGATVKHTSPSKILAFKTKVPPLPIQKKIAKILLNYDDLIENNLKQIKLLEEKARLTYEEWFLRFRIDGQKLDIDEDTGLPLGWKEDFIQTVCNVSSSKRIFASDYVESGIPFYRGKEITIKSQNGTLSSEYFITKERYEEIKKKFGTPVVNDILITAVGTLGSIYMVNSSDREFYFKDGNLIWLNNFKNDLHIYLFYSFKNDILQQAIQNVAIGSSQKALTIQAAKKLRILIPETNIIKKYNIAIEPILEEINILQKQNHLLKESRDILLPRLMTGMIDVENMDIEV